VEIFLLIVLVPALLITFSGAFRSGADTQSWDLRWNSLQAADRIRISKAARSGAKLDDPEESELAGGFNRHDRRRGAYVEFPALSIVVVLTALSLAGLVDGGLVAFVIACGTVGIALWRYLREKRMNGEPRAASSPDRGLYRSRREISRIVSSGRSRRSSQPSLGRR
jgi:hypothetical protein